MAKKKKNDRTPYLVDRAAGALMKYEGLDKKEAYRTAVMALQAAGLIRPGSMQLTKIGKDVQRRLKIRRAKRKKKK